MAAIALPKKWTPELLAKFDLRSMDEEEFAAVRAECDQAVQFLLNCEKGARDPEPVIIRLMKGNTPQYYCGVRYLARDNSPAVLVLGEKPKQLRKRYYCYRDVDVAPGVNGPNRHTPEDWFVACYLDRKGYAKLTPEQRKMHPGSPSFILRPWWPEHGKIDDGERYSYWRFDMRIIPLDLIPRDED